LSLEFSLFLSLHSLRTTTGCQASKLIARRRSRHAICGPSHQSVLLLPTSSESGLGPGAGRLAGANREELPVAESLLVLNKRKLM
jgi:hypothetical protein